MKTINLEENMPTVIDAMDNLKQSIALAKATKTKVMVIIHGYGSSGRGGAICKSARQWLKAQERNGKFKTVIFGENFDLFNEQARIIKDKYPDTKEQFGRCNNGITILEL